MRTLLKVSAIALVVGIAGSAHAQGGCTYTKAIVCDGEIVCTTSTGTNCVTCDQ